jgi:hypothetical protein
MRKAMIVGFTLVICSMASAHNSYTGGYSGAPGTLKCASACHGGTGGTVVITGFPWSYVPGRIYRVVVARAAGSPIVNFNATTRVGSTTTVGGTFAAITNSALFTGADGGVYASPHAIDSAVFTWTAPAQGTGPVTFYAAAYQGTTTSRNGQSSAVTITSTEVVTKVEDEITSLSRFNLLQNFPNPFNPSTTIRYRLDAPGTVSLKIFNAVGEEIAVLADGHRSAGSYTVRWDAAALPSGVYFCRLRAGGFQETRRMVLAK